MMDPINSSTDIEMMSLRASPNNSREVLPIARLHDRSDCKITATLVLTIVVPIFIVLVVAAAGYGVGTWGVQQIGTVINQTESHVTSAATAVSGQLEGMVEEKIQTAMGILEDKFVNITAHFLEQMKVVMREELQAALRPPQGIGN